MSSEDPESRPPSSAVPAADTPPPGKSRVGLWICVGLVLGILCGITFGEYCAPLQVPGDIYVGLLQMTVLPYLVLSLIAKSGRLDSRQARQIGVIAVSFLALFWLVGIVMVTVASTSLPSIESASFFNSSSTLTRGEDVDLMTRFIPTNVFYSLSREYVPAVVLFCLFFGFALMAMPGKEPLLDLLDLCASAISRINLFLVRLAPFGLFMFAAAAAGTLRLDELARLQAYLVVVIVASVIVCFVILPMLVWALTDISYRRLMAVAQEPALTAFATGKLLVVLPQIVEKCDQLAEEQPETDEEPSTPSIVVPLAYAFPHMGKILAFTFISFAAWYVGEQMTPPQTFLMTCEGAVSSFASPLVTMPYLLDEYQLPQDLMAFFILPGFLTARLSDVVGVAHLMALTLLVTFALQGRLRVRWNRLLRLGLVTTVCLAVAVGASRWSLSHITLEYDLDNRLLSLSIPHPYNDVIVYKTRDDLPSDPTHNGSTFERIKQERVLRVGYQADHFPYSFFNAQQELVGLDVELMHHLAARLRAKLEFVPYEYDTVVSQLKSGEIDVAIGGLIENPERLLEVGFTGHYHAATLSVVTRDHRRSEFETLDNIRKQQGLRLAVQSGDLAAAGRQALPNVEFVPIAAYRSYFEGTAGDLDGLVVPAEEGAAWTVLYPGYTVVVPTPAMGRPIGMAVRLEDQEWRNFLDRWLDFERLDGDLDRLQSYWIEGNGATQMPPRWSVMQNVLHWLP